MTVLILRIKNLMMLVFRNGFAMCQERGWRSSSGFLARQMSRCSHPRDAHHWERRRPRRHGFTGRARVRLPEHQPHSTRSSRPVHHDAAIHVTPTWERRRPRQHGFSGRARVRLPEHQPHSARSSRPVHHDAAIHVRPPGSAGALAGRVSQDATQSDFPHLNLIRPAVPGPCTTMQPST